MKIARSFSISFATSHLRVADLSVFGAKLSKELGVNVQYSKSPGSRAGWGPN